MTKLLVFPQAVKTGPLKFAPESLSRAGRRVNWQRGVVAEGRFQTFDGTAFVTTIRDTGDAYSADHLTIDNNRDSARDCEQIKEYGVTRQAARIVLELRGADGGGLAQLQRGLRTQ